MWHLEREALHAFLAAFFSPAAKSASPSTCTHGDFSTARFLGTLAASEISRIRKMMKKICRALVCAVEDNQK
jgi:hypothetical protein